MIGRLAWLLLALPLALPLPLTLALVGLGYLAYLLHRAGHRAGHADLDLGARQPQVGRAEGDLLGHRLGDERELPAGVLHGRDHLLGEAFCSLAVQIADNPDNQVLTQALLSIARHFDMFTVAEQVENADDATYLTQIGVDCLQGYFYGAPTVQNPWQQQGGERRSA